MPKGKTVEIKPAKGRPMLTWVGKRPLRNVLAYLNVPTLGQPEAFIQAKDDLFNQDGSLGEGSRKFLQGWMDQYVAWIRKHAA